MLKTVKLTTCLLDAYPTWLIKVCGEDIRACLGEIINLFLSSGTFPPGLKEIVVCLLFKKPSLDTVVLPNCHPVLNLPSLGKVVERLVAEQL